MSVESVTVESIMTKDVKTARAGQTVKAVANIMIQNNIGSVVITETENNTPVGIITERDVVRIAGTTETFMPPLLARDIMSKPIVTIGGRSSIQDAIESMKLNNIRRLPVVDREGKMVGIITDKDIFKAIINSQSLVASIRENVTIEYRPMYERLNEFMMGEMLLPRGNDPN